MSHDRQRRALALFEAALDEPEAERDAWVGRQADGPETAAAVRRLLRVDSDASIYLASAPPTGGTPTPEAPPPERVGVYRLTGRVGRGGMGDVYLGERDDGLFEQRVAVKLMRPSLFPQASRAFFDTERRALARLRHRGIAQIYDGGVAAGGQPYLVMELLDGAPIDERLQGALARTVVRAVAEVCAAVQHAHQNLVVHADIKPSNVVVDADGAPKLLDFGIAQMLSEPGGGGPAAFPVTPRYASPARMAGERPVPADDVYALGVLLYELLAGGAWPDAGAGRPALAEADLEAVVRRATAPAADARYTSAAALADDLNRWLEQRPVQARPQTTAYVLSRYWRRRRWALSAAAAGLAGLVVALSVITALYVESRAARAAAERRYADVRGMAKYMLFDVYDRLDRAPRTLAVRRDLARVGQGYLDQLSADANASTAVRMEAVQGLLRLAAVQGSGNRHLGETKQAVANLDKAVRLATVVHAAEPGDIEAVLALAQAHLRRASIHTFSDNDLPAADRAFEESRRWLDKAAAIRPDHPELAELRVDHAVQLADQRGWQSRPKEAVAEARRAVQLASALPPDTAGTRRRLARAYDTWADNLFYAGDEKGAVPLFQRSYALFERLHAEAPDDPGARHAFAREGMQLGVSLVSVGRGGESLPILERSLTLAQANVAFDPENMEAARALAINRGYLASALSANGRHDEAIAHARENIAWRQRRREATGAPGEARDLAIAVATLGDLYKNAGRRADACATLREADAMYDAIMRRGELTELDAAYGRRLIRESRVAVGCA